MHNTGLAPFACLPSQSRGRMYSENGSSTRTCFQRDRDRIIHSTGFRRLEYKTQVFVNHEGDHYRTRLTHSLEVAQIARSISRSLNLNEDLSEALALAHDLGHTPFGHAGEEALSNAMQPYGGFDHNAQSIAVVTRLERRYPNFPGLNLTWETLEGLAKHNGPLQKSGENLFISSEVRNLNKHFDLELDTYASAEAQVSAISDDIAYNNHDIDDGLRAHLFAIEDLWRLPVVGDTFKKVEEEYPRIEKSLIVHEGIRRLIGLMVKDCLKETEIRLKQYAPKSVAEIRALEYPVVGFSGEMLEVDRTLKGFLFEHMYRHEKVVSMTEEANKIVSKLFEEFLFNPEKLPSEWGGEANSPGSQLTADSVADYIAGMTDRFAMDEYNRLFGCGVFPK